MTVPQEAITAAGNAMRHKWLHGRPAVAALDLDPMDWAATAVEAAAPHIAAAERERIRQLATQHNAQYVPDCPDPACPGPTAHMADEAAPFADLLTGGDTT